MSLFRQILVPVDFSTESCCALAQALLLAESTRARLTVLHVHPYWSFAEISALVPPMPHASQDLRGMLLHELASFAAATHPVAVADPIEVVVRGGDPIDETLTAAEQAGADLIVLATHARPGTGLWSLGAVAERIVCEASASVLVLRAQERPPAARFSAIVCALDLGETSSRALDVAAALARGMEAPLTVLHVAETEGGYLDQAQQRVGQLLSSHAGAEGWKISFLQGSAREEILRAIRSSTPDVLVLGAQPKRLAGSLFVGATTQYVLHRAPCAVLLARGSRAVQAVEEDRRALIGEQA